MSEVADHPPRIGRYVIEQVLGRGAMGVVYKGHDPAIDRPVAIKLVRTDLLDSEEREAFLTRFRREAQLAARCAHANIVAVYDFAMHEGNPFLTMEYVRGASLAKVLELHGRLAPGPAVRIMTQVLGALAGAHAMGIIHRDIKPANILLLPDGTPKVTDFGISRMDSVGVTHTGTLLGTPSYMSPEQCRGEQVDARSDLFSAGVVLYEMLAGERPFPGRGITEVMHRVLTEAPKDLRPMLGPSAGLMGVIDRALAKDRGARFHDAGEMASALRSAASGGAAAKPDDATVVLSSGIRGVIRPEVLDRAQRELTEYLGPIARLLVRRAAAEARSSDEFWEALGKHIERPADRAAFLRGRR